MHSLGRDVARPEIEDRERVVHAPEPPLAPIRGHRLAVDYVREPVLPARSIAVLDGLLPLGWQQGAHVTDCENEMNLGRLQ